MVYKMKKITLIGSLQGEHISDLLNRNGLKAVYIKQKNNNLLYKLKVAYHCLVTDYVYLIYIGYAPNRKFLKYLRLLRKKIVFHWIGTDVYNCIHNSETNVQYPLDITHLAGSQLLHDELKNIGIKSIIVPIIPFSMDLSIMDMPDTHRVLNYVPNGRERFYSADVVVNLAKRNQDIIFDVVGTDKFEGINEIPENICFHGKVSKDGIQKIYKNITILLRIPLHDGLSMMVIEALAKGKYVLYKYRHPYVYTPDSNDIEDIDKTLKKILKSKPKINFRGHDYVKKYYNEDEMMKLYKINKIFGE